MATANSILCASAELTLADAQNFQSTPAALSVIAIDDNQIDLQLLRRLFSEIGDWRILWHGYLHSDAAIADFEQTTPDIIFLDYLVRHLTLSAIC